MLLLLLCLQVGEADDGVVVVVVVVHVVVHVVVVVVPCRSVRRMMTVVQ